MSLFFGHQHSRLRISGCREARARPRSPQARGRHQRPGAQRVHHVAHRKRDGTWPEIEAALAAHPRSFPRHCPDHLATHAAAVALARDHSLAFYDALDPRRRDRGGLRNALQRGFPARPTIRRLHDRQSVSQWVGRMKACVSSQRARAVCGLRPRETADIPFTQLGPLQGDPFLMPPRARLAPGRLMGF